MLVVKAFMDNNIEKNLYLLPKGRGTTMPMEKVFYFQHIQQ